MGLTISSLFNRLFGKKQVRGRVDKKPDLIFGKIFNPPLKFIFLPNTKEIFRFVFWWWVWMRPERRRSSTSWNSEKLLARFRRSVSAFVKYYSESLKWYHSGTDSTKNISFSAIFGKKNHHHHHKKWLSFLWQLPQNGYHFGKFTKRDYQISGQRFFRFQRGDGRVQEYLVHGVGRGRSGQDSSPVETLLPEHPGTHLRGMAY